MRFIKNVIRPLCAMLASAACTLPIAQAQTAPNISDVPLFLNAGVPPLNMIVLGRDHKLYYEAYNDASDLDDDGTLDIRYKPSINYYGYFDSFKCYTHDGSRFNPVSVTANKRCSGQWSGDFLNYLTTSRIDALRKVLYGGLRSDDPTNPNNATVLERSFIPQDAHSWGKEYSVDHASGPDGYNINDYTPYAMPTGSNRHLFANTTPLGTTNPLLRVLLNQGTVTYQSATHQVRIWNWVSIERPVAGGRLMHGGNGPTVTPTDLIVRVRVCDAAIGLESNCNQYPNGNYKPTGLLQEFGENDAMYFGLLSGSYANNTSGGVLRRNIGSIRDEVNADTDGTFRSFDGIVRSLNRLSVTGFGTGHEYSCGWISNRAIAAGECQMWGNPIAEMMYETLRYFAGRANPTGAFATTFGQGQEGSLAGGGLPVASSWVNPYANRPFCSKPFQTVVSDINPSYDSDQLPGASFGPLAEPGDDLDGMDVTTLGQQIWNAEIGGTQKVFIGQAPGASDGAPTPKDVSSFGNIRGLAPEEPTKQGSYYSASVAHHGRTMEIGSLNAAAPDNVENVNTFAVALASPLPRIDIPVSDGTTTRTITLVPFAKSVQGTFGGNIVPTQGTFQPTNQIVDFYVESLGATSGSFRVNFEDVEQGADHDMDAVARYQYQVNGNGTVTVTVTSEYAAGSIVQHMGYIVSGSTADGTYLVVRDCDTQGSCPGSPAAGVNDVDYFLDTPPAFTGTPPAPASGGGTWDDDQPLTWGGPGGTASSARTFTPGTEAAATLLKDPLWYAAKWGGFKEETATANGRPDIATEWDADGDGNPDNYFLVTNALKLGEQLTQAFNDILDRVGSASSASVNSGSISSTTRIYQAKFSFNSGDWSGQLLSFPVLLDGSLSPTEEWDAARQIPAPNARRIITVNSNGTSAVPFQWGTGGIDATRKGQLDPTTDGFGEDRLNYLRGLGTFEVTTGAPQFRKRPQTPFRNVLGDIVSSAPMFVGRPPFMYPDLLESAPYSAFVGNNADRRHMVYAGANDGMLHGFDGETGQELLAFIPGAVFTNLHELTKPSYTHRYYVDGSPTMGDAFYDGAWHTVLVGGLNKGGNSIYALDITDPDDFSEADADNIFLWEYTDADLGYTYSRPAVVRLQGNPGRWAAVFGSGYPDGVATGKAVLYIVDIETGSLIRKIDTGVGAGSNGLSTPALVDLNGDSIVDLAYAGDLLGNMWKFDLRGATAADWDVAYKPGGVAQPLFTARDAANNPQPITSRPEVGRGPRGAGTMVLFGTGRYLGVADKTPTQTQTFYGIHDPNTLADTDRISGRGVLTSQEIIVEDDFPFATPDGNISVPLRVTTNNAVNNRGWYLDLLQPPNPPGTFQGEMQVSDSILRTGRIIFTTLIPDADPCTAGGTSWLMELDALTGSRLAASPFDLNRDVEFDGDDFVEVELPDGTIVEVPVSGIKSEVGITPKPGILAGPNAEYKYTPGTTGEIQVTVENPGESATGRQSWRQIR